LGKAIVGYKKDRVAAAAGKEETSVDKKRAKTKPAKWNY